MFSWHVKGSCRLFDHLSMERWGSFASHGIWVAWDYFPVLSAEALKLCQLKTYLSKRLASSTLISQNLNYLVKR